MLGVAFDAGNVYAVHNSRAAATGAIDGKGSLAVLDRKTLTVQSQIAVGLDARAVAVNPVTSRAYVVNRGTGTGSTLSVVNTATRKVIASINLGQVAADVAVNTKLNRVYISNPGQEDIQVLNGANNALLAPVQVGKGLGGLAVDEATGTVYVTMSSRGAGNDFAKLGRVRDNGATRTRAAVDRPRRSGRPGRLTSPSTPARAASSSPGRRRKSRERDLMSSWTTAAAKLRDCLRHRQASPRRAAVDETRCAGDVKRTVGAPCGDPRRLSRRRGGPPAADGAHEPAWRSGVVTTMYVRIDAGDGGEQVERDHQRSPRLTLRDPADEESARIRRRRRASISVCRPHQASRPGSADSPVRHASR